MQEYDDDSSGGAEDPPVTPKRVSRNITRQIDLPSSCQLTRTMVMREKLHENSNPGNWPICDNALIEVGPAWWQCEHSMPNTSALEKYEQLAAFNIAGTVDQEAPVRGTAVS